MIKVSNSRMYLTAAVLLALCACHRQPPVEVPPIVISKPAQPPEGVVRYCWEEPKVVLEQNGPGVDSEGHYYHPSYRAVREAKMGRWVPCN